MSRSLHRSLLIRTGFVTAIVLLLAGVVLYALVAASLRSEVDAALISKARLLASTIEQGPLGIEMEFDDLDMGEFHSSEGPGFLQLWRADGALLFRSPSLGESDLPRPLAGRSEPAYCSVALPGAASGRAVSLTFAPRLEDEAVSPDEGSGAPEAGTATITLVLAHLTASTDRMLARFRLLLIALLVAVIGVMSATLTWAVRSSLTPVARVASDIAGIAEQDLAIRVPERGVPREIAPVVIRLNQLLSRLQRAFERERSFSADVAHELRTPLAGLQSILEVSLSRSRSPEEYRTTLEESLVAAGHLEALVANLLDLARIESGASELQMQTVSISALLRSIWERFRDRAAARGLTVRWELGTDRELVTDPVLLATATRNILDNAVEHSDEGGQVTIATTSAPGGLSLHVANTGCRLTQDEAESLSDRFRRGDTARPVSGTHYGLGLSLIRGIVRVLGGTMRIEVSPGGLYQIILTLPRRGPERSSSPAAGSA